LLSVLLLSSAAESVLAQTYAFGSEAEATSWAEQVMSRMTLEEKVGQIVFIDITGNYAAGDDLKLQGWLKLVNDYGVGGIVSYGGTPRDLAARV
jgi:hypothetical protein